MNEPEVAGAQKRAFTRIGEASAKTLVSLFFVVPVARGDTLAADPHLTDFGGGARRQPQGIDDNHAVVRQHTSAAYQRARVFDSRRLGDAVQVERLLRDLLNEWRPRLRVTGDD